MSAWKNLSKNIRELRIHLCQSSTGSQGARDFLLKNYLTIAKENPSVPVLIREAQGVPARVFARYAFGVEKKVVLENLSPAEVESRILGLAEQGPKK